ncbi:MAG: helix-turn-helix transcriptional regulator [Anaerovoracaceae bacterium]
MLNLYILEILKKYSDDEHHLTQKKIISLLQRDFDIVCDRRSVKNNIDYLSGMDIEIGSDDGYWLVEREFDDAELRMLIDSVLFSRGVTQKQAKRLIGKLANQSNIYFSAKVSHISNLPQLYHSPNKYIMYSVDTLDDAISRRRKVEFTYNYYGRDFKLHPRREEAYKVSPYQMVAANGRFYLICNSEGHNNVAHYRVDRMTDVRMLEEKRRNPRELVEFRGGFDLPQHMAEHIYMFSGESAQVLMRCQNGMMNDLIDWFGSDIRIEDGDSDDYFLVHLRCNKRAMFYWALQYGLRVEVLEPEDLREEIARAVAEMAAKYSR